MHSPRMLILLQLEGQLHPSIQVALRPLLAPQEAEIDVHKLSRNLIDLSRSFDSTLLVNRSIAPVSSFQNDQRFQSEIANLRAYQFELERQHATELSAISRRHEAEIGVLNVRIAQLVDQHRSHLEEIELQRQHDIETYLLALAESKRESHRLQLRYDELKAQYDDLKAENDSLYSDLSTMRSAMAVLERETADLRPPVVASSSLSTTTGDVPESSAVPSDESIASKPIESALAIDPQSTAPTAPASRTDLWNLFTFKTSPLSLSSTQPQQQPPPLNLDDRSVSLHGILTQMLVQPPFACTDRISSAVDELKPYFSLSIARIQQLERWSLLGRRWLPPFLPRDPAEISPCDCIINAETRCFQLRDLDEGQLVDLSVTLDASLHTPTREQLDSDGFSTELRFALLPVRTWPLQQVLVDRHIVALTWRVTQVEHANLIAGPWTTTPSSFSQCRRRHWAAVLLVFDAAQARLDHSASPSPLLAECLACFPSPIA